MSGTHNIISLEFAQSLKGDRLKIDASTPIEADGRILVVQKGVVTLHRTIPDSEGSGSFTWPVGDFDAGTIIPLPENSGSGEESIGRLNLVPEDVAEVELVSAEDLSAKLEEQPDMIAYLGGNLLDRLFSSFSVNSLSNEPKLVRTTLDPGTRSFQAGDVVHSSNSQVCILKKGKLKLSSCHEFTVDADHPRFMFWMNSTWRVLEDTTLEVLSSEEVNTTRAVNWLRLMTTQALVNIADDVDSAFSEKVDIRVHERKTRKLIEQDIFKSLFDSDLPVEKPLASEHSGLISALTMVAQATKVKPNRPLERATGSNLSDQIGELGQQGGFRNRKVSLTAAWWKNDNGPLIGQMVEGGHPVALIPIGRGRYKSVEFIDGVKHEQPKIGAKEAARYEPWGWMLYRPFPNRQLRLRDLAVYALQGSRNDIITIVLATIVASALSLVIPYFTGVFIDDIVPLEQRSALAFLGVGLFAAVLGASSMKLVSQISFLRLETRSNFQTLAAFVDRVLSLPAPFFRSMSSGEISQRVMAIERIRAVLTHTSLHGITSIIPMIAYLVFLSMYMIELAILALVAIIISTAMAWWLSWLSIRAERVSQDREGRLTGLSMQMLQGIDKLRIASAEDRGILRWARLFRDAQEASYLARLSSVRLRAFDAMFGLVVTAALYVAYLYLSEQAAVMDAMIAAAKSAKPGAVSATKSAGGVTTGQFLAINVAFGAVLGIGRKLGTDLVPLVREKPVLDRLRPIMDAVPESKDDQLDAPDLSGDVSLRHVSFRYDESLPEVLKDVTITAKAGEFIAITGSSGAGKSTILRMILGLDIPDSGAVFFGDEQLSSLNLGSVRRQLGVAIQDGQLLPGDIHANIVGASQIDIDRVWQAAEDADIANDIRSMPMGMHTIASSSNLSGGQVQRILVARALVTSPRILLFDEATSALDNKAQSKVMDSICRYKATRIVIAHRLSTIKTADRIYVIDQGKVVQQGNYEELMSQDGLFKSLAERQLT